MLASERNICIVFSGTFLAFLQKDCHSVHSQTIILQCFWSTSSHFCVKYKWNSRVINFQLNTRPPQQAWTHDWDNSIEMGSRNEATVIAKGHTRHKQSSWMQISQSSGKALTTTAFQIPDFRARKQVTPSWRDSHLYVILYLTHIMFLCFKRE